MSTSVPITVPSIPSPNDTGASLVQTLWALKQNIEIAQATRGSALSANLHGPTNVNTYIGAALTTVQKTLP